MSNILIVYVCRRNTLANLPFGGGLTSVSPCWFELSDCPDCSEIEEKKRESDGQSDGQMSGQYPS